jgi:hypothetical protein
MLSNHVLTDSQIEEFVYNGFVRIEGAFPETLARKVRDVLWRDTGCDPDDPTTWTKPVIRLGMYKDKPFVDAANTAVLQAAYDQLVGSGRWLACSAVGSFPVRFPVPSEPGDTGWHVDMSLDWEKPDFMDWRVNVASEGRALLMLYLFSDVGNLDAPTRLRMGSHLDVARKLAPAGEKGLTMRELVEWFPETDQRPQVAATGNAGTVFLCHPFVVHAAQAHRGVSPRFMAQPALLPRSPMHLFREDSAYSPVETAIRFGLKD